MSGYPTEAAQNITGPCRIGLITSPCPLPPAHTLTQRILLAHKDQEIPCAQECRSIESNSVRKFGKGANDANPDSKFNVPLPPSSATKKQKTTKAQGKQGGSGSWGKKKKKRPAEPILQGKAAKRARQLEKPHGDKVVQAKSCGTSLGIGTLMQ